MHIEYNCRYLNILYIVIVHSRNELNELLSSDTILSRRGRQWSDTSVYLLCLFLTFKNWYIFCLNFLDIYHTNKYQELDISKMLAWILIIALKA